jgi:hypothetical protein
MKPPDMPDFSRTISASSCGVFREHPGLIMVKSNRAAKMTLMTDFSDF